MSAFLSANSFSNIIVVGDLNIILVAKEKRGCVSGRDPMIISVENLILSWESIDFKPKKGCFWTNNRVGAANISARLDRFLVQSSFLLEGGKLITSSILAKLSSDHKPNILPIEDEEDLGPIPFRFSPLWKEQEGFMDIVSLAWDIPAVGSLNYVWEKKLKNTKVALKNWVKISHKNLVSERKEAVKKLEEIQMEMEEFEITHERLEKEQRAQLCSFRAFRREEEYWRLKSRSTWLLAGDMNTYFFHK